MIWFPSKGRSAPAILSPHRKNCQSDNQVSLLMLVDMNEIFVEN